MISCPAAKQIRCVKPSIATVSPSCTNASTASCMVATLSELTRPSVLGAAQHAELVALGIAHHGPEAPALVDPGDRGGAERLQPRDLGCHRAARAQVEMQAVLHGLVLGDGLEEHRPSGADGRLDDGVLLVDMV